MASFEYYKNSNKNYNNNGDIRIPMIAGTLTFEINSTNEVDIDISYDKYGLWKKIERFGIIKVKVPYTKNKQLYRIYDLEKDMLSYKIKARHIFFDLVNNILLDNRPTNCNCQSALNNILANTAFTGQSNITLDNTAYYINTNCVQAINGDIDQSILNRWGGEILQDNFKVIINTKLGGDYGVKIKYGLNMENVTLDDPLDNIYTRIYPMAYNGIMLPEKYIDSPIISNYPIIKTNFISMEDLRLKDSNTNEDTSTDDSTTYFDTEDELYQAMRYRCNTLFANGLDKPSISGTVNMIALENTLEYQHFKNLVNVGIGDTLTVEHKDIGIDLSTRCVGFEYDLTTEKYNKVDLGSIQTNYFNSQSDIQSTVDNILNKTNNILNPDGSIKAQNIQGIIDGTKTKMQVMRNISSDSQVKAVLFEDKVKGSITYGAMALGTMGFMIANERTLDNKDWIWRTFGTGAGFIADMLTAGTINTNNITIANNDKSFLINNENLIIMKDNIARVFLGLTQNSNGDTVVDFTLRNKNSNAVLSADDDGNLTMLGDVILKNENGQLTASLQDFGLNIYDSFNAGSFVGGIQSVENTKDNSKRGLQIYADNITDNTNFISLGNRISEKANKDGYNFNSNINIYNDHNDILKNTNLKETDLNFIDNDRNFIGGILTLDDGTVAYCTNWDKPMRFCYEDNGKWYDAMNMNRDNNPRWQVYGGMNINGNFTVTGTKNRIVETENFGTLKLNAYETAEAFFGDIGEVTLDPNGYCKVVLEDKFKETIERNNKYQVFVTKYGHGDVFISKRNKDFFILQGTPNLKVVYEIKAKQKGYKDIRLEEFIKPQED